MTATAPRIFHLIWFGKTIPMDYLINILRLNHISKTQGYQVMIWTDREETITKTLWQLTDHDQWPGISIRTIDRDLLPLFKNDPFYTPFKRATLTELIEFEQTGIPNYATISDFYRLEILYQFGGVYLDTDVKLISHDVILDGEPLYTGIKFNAQIQNVDNRLFNLNINNDVIIAEKYCPDLRLLIEYMLEKYESLHQVIDTRTRGFKHFYFFYNAAALDLKRTDQQGRFTYTIDCGPGVFSDYLMQIKNNKMKAYTAGSVAKKDSLFFAKMLEITKNSIQSGDKNYRMINDVISQMDDYCLTNFMDEELRIIKIGGIFINAKNDHNWGLNEVTSFDDDVIKKPFLSSPWRS
jgi:hypothetical protein